MMMLVSMSALRIHQTMLRFWQALFHSKKMMHLYRLQMDRDRTMILDQRHLEKNYMKKSTREPTYHPCYDQLVIFKHTLQTDFSKMKCKLDRKEEPLFLGKAKLNLLNSLSKISFMKISCLPKCQKTLNISQWKCRLRRSHVKKTRM